MKKIAAYLIPVLACFAVGISASFFQASSIAEWYPTLTKPGTHAAQHRISDR